MGFDLSSVLKDVSKLDTGTSRQDREQIEYLDISELYSDPANFYSLDGIEALAANIELCGLQQPLRVRIDPDNCGYWIVSGHRRYNAIRTLYEEDNEKWQTIPCIVEKDNGSAALSELRLIYANSDTRRMTGADLSKQAQRVEALLYELKEEGFDFPGRMRDHVAEACKVSASKLARLKVIREGLDAGIAKHWENNELAENAAYTLAQMPIEKQRQVFQLLSAGNKGAAGIMEWRIKETATLLDRKTSNSCKEAEDGTCSHAWIMMEKLSNIKSYDYCGCRENDCCADCKNLVTCSVCCPKLKEKQTELKAKRKEDKKAEAEEKKVRELEAVAPVKDVWHRFGEARKAAGISAEDYCSAVNMPYLATSKEVESYENGEGRLSEFSVTPFGYSFKASELKHIKDACKVLDCSADYLLGISDELKASNKNASDSGKPLTWRRGDIPWRGWYLIQYPNGAFDALKLAPEYEYNDNYWHASDFKILKWAMISIDED